MINGFLRLGAPMFEWLPQLIYSITALVVSAFGMHGILRDKSLSFRMFMYFFVFIDLFIWIALVFLLPLIYFLVIYPQSKSRCTGSDASCLLVLNDQSVKMQMTTAALVLGALLHVSQPFEYFSSCFLFALLLNQ
jgi:membrane glycosyltransferase